MEPTQTVTFAEAAADLQEGKFSGVVRSDKGFHVIKCLKVIPAVEKKLADVEKDIARELVVADLAAKKVMTEGERLLAGILNLCERLLA